MPSPLSQGFLPADAVDVELTFQEPSLIVAAFWASKLAWLAVAVLLALHLVTYNRRKTPTELSTV